MDQLTFADLEFQGKKRKTHHVHILEMNGDSYRLKGNRQDAASLSPDYSSDV